MATKQQDSCPAGLKNPERQQVLDAIGLRVIQTLGRPDDLYQVPVRWLWGDCYRVNILVGKDAAFARIAHSYFLTVGNPDHAFSSIPDVSKVY
jgi:hypothetical protein